MTATLVERLEATVGPLPPPWRDVYLAVDRARFVRPCDRELADENWPLPLDTPLGPTVPPAAEIFARHGGKVERVIADPEFKAAVATISAPLIYALGFRVLGLGAGHRLLELGSGSGYGAALASRFVGPSGHVTTVEIDPHLVALTRKNLDGTPNVTVLEGDGLARPDLVAGHDHVWLTFSTDDVPRALADALPEGGVLLAPVGPPPPALQKWKRVERRKDGFLETEAPFPVMFIRSRSEG